MDLTPRRPIYREAYPRFDIIRAQRAFNRAPSGCLFKIGRNTVGQLIIPDSNLDSVLIAYSIGGPHSGFGKGELWIRTRDVPNPVHRDRRAMLCPQCSAHTGSIFFKEQWACARCHSLLYRSQIVDKRALEWETYEKLRILKSSGRPKGMHNRTYANLLDGFDALQLKLEGCVPMYAADEHCHECSSDWIPLNDFGELWVPGYKIQDGDVVVDLRTFG